MKVICEICGEDFDAWRFRKWGNRCEDCAEWLRALVKGPFQEGDADYEKLGLVIAFLLKTGKLKERDFIHGLVNGLKR